MVQLKLNTLSLAVGSAGKATILATPVRQMLIIRMISQGNSSSTTRKIVWRLRWSKISHSLFNNFISHFQFLITTSRTGFSVRYLYEMSLNILYLHGSFRYSRVDWITSDSIFFSLFSGMAKMYTALHLGDFTDEDLKNAKDMSERTESMHEDLFFSLFICLVLF